jgi:CheY-like chemotaxis protein
MLGPVCIVIAEDNYVLRRVVVQYLATFGITAIEAGTETEAWSALATGGADVLVLDMLISSTRTMLPFLQRIRKYLTLGETKDFWRTQKRPDSTTTFCNARMRQDPYYMGSLAAFIATVLQKSGY